MIRKSRSKTKKRYRKHLLSVLSYIFRTPTSWASENSVENLIRVRLLLLHSCEAFRAVYRSVVAGLEGNLSFLTALSANRGKHVSFLTFAGRVLSLVAACLASLGFGLEALFCVEFLFACGEYEFVASILAYQCLVLIHLCLPRFDK